MKLKFDNSSNENTTTRANITKILHDIQLEKLKIALMNKLPAEAEPVPHPVQAGRVA